MFYINKKQLGRIQSTTMPTAMPVQVNLANLLVLSSMATFLAIRWVPGLPGFTKLCCWGSGLKRLATLALAGLARGVPGLAGSILVVCVKLAKTIYRIIVCYSLVWKLSSDWINLSLTSRVIHFRSVLHSSNITLHAGNARLQDFQVFETADSEIVHQTTTIKI